MSWRAKLQAGGGWWLALAALVYTFGLARLHGQVSPAGGGGAPHYNLPGLYVSSAGSVTTWTNILSQTQLRGVNMGNAAFLGTSASAPAWSNQWFNFPTLWPLQIKPAIDQAKARGDNWIKAILDVHVVHSGALSRATFLSYVKTMADYCQAQGMWFTPGLSGQSALVGETLGDVEAECNADCDLLNTYPNIPYIDVMVEYKNNNSGFDLPYCSNLVFACRNHTTNLLTCSQFGIHGNTNMIYLLNNYCHFDVMDQHEYNIPATGQTMDARSDIASLRAIGLNSHIYFGEYGSSQQRAGLNQFTDLTTVHYLLSIGSTNCSGVAYWSSWDAVDTTLFSPASSQQWGMNDSNGVVRPVSTNLNSYNSTRTNIESVPSLVYAFPEAGSPSTTGDFSFTGNTLSVLGSPTWTTGTINGIAFGGITLDGATQYAQLNPPVNVTGDDTHPFSVVAWFKTTDNNAGHGNAVMATWGINQQAGWTCRVTQGALVLLLAHAAVVGSPPTANYRLIETATGLANDGAIHMAVWTWAGTAAASGCTFYVDGALVASPTIVNDVSPGAFSTSLPLTVGGESSSPVATFFTGTLYQGEYFNTNISAWQVAAEFARKPLIRPF